MHDATLVGFIAFLFGIALAAGIIVHVESWFVRASQRRRFRVVMELDRPRTRRTDQGGSTGGWTK